MSVPLRAADTGHTWPSTQNVAAPRRGWRVYNAISLSSDPCCCVARAQGGCAQSWQHPHHPTPALLQVGDRPRSSRAPEGPTLAPQHMAASAYLKVSGAFREDPGVTLEHRQLTLTLPSPPSLPPTPTGLPGAQALPPCSGRCWAPTRTESSCLWGGVATGPEPRPSTRQLTRPQPWAARTSGKRTGVLTGVDSALGAPGHRRVKPTMPGTPPEKLWGPLPSTHGGSRRSRGAREAW